MDLLCIIPSIEKSSLVEAVIKTLKLMVRRVIGVTNIKNYVCVTSQRIVRIDTWKFIKGRKNIIINLF